MMLDIFSAFDDHSGASYSLSFVVWGVGMIAVISIPGFWFSSGGSTGLLSTLLKVVDDLVVRSKAKVLGSASFYSSLFVILVCFNLWGLVPYVFSTTSHLAVNLQISLPVWLAIVLMSVTYNLGDFLSHLQPLGAPAPLNPMLCLIELVSLSVRPLTLAVRLTANLSTGHILMALLGVGFMNQFLLLILGMFYFMFEMAVCFIQAYIFTLLPTLYSDDHS